jgi:hypothetical protein
MRVFGSVTEAIKLVAQTSDIYEKELQSVYDALKILLKTIP